jgi:hypothetical protein
VVWPVAGTYSARFDSISVKAWSIQLNANVAAADWMMQQPARLKRQGPAEQVVFNQIHSWMLCSCTKCMGDAQGHRSPVSKPKRVPGKSGLWRIPKCKWMRN